MLNALHAARSADSRRSTTTKGGAGVDFGEEQAEQTVPVAKRLPLVGHRNAFLGFARAIVLPYLGVTKTLTFDPSAREYVSSHESLQRYYQAPQHLDTKETGIEKRRWRRP